MTHRRAPWPALVWAPLAVALALLPAVLGPYHLLLVASALVLAIAALGVDLLLGHAGLLSLGHAAFFGTGAYAGAFLFTFFDVGAFEAYLLAGLAVSTGLAAVLGAVCARATRIQFSILSLALAQVVHAFFVSGAAFRPFGDTGKGFFLVGDGGLYIPRLTMAGAGLDPEPFVRALYLVTVAAFGLAVLAVGRVLRSPFGMALRAIRDSQTRAEAVGVPVRACRWRAFVLSGALVGLAGALAGELDRQVTPEQLHWLTSARLVLAVVLGGPGTPAGPVIGAFALSALREASARFPGAHDLVLGALLVAAVRLLPGGLARPAVALAGRLVRRRRPPAGTGPCRGPGRPLS